MSPELPSATLDAPAQSLPLVSPGDSIRRAMEIINVSSKGIALVTDPELRLLGVITDGDVRRAILAGADLDADLASLLARKPTAAPITAEKGATKEELLALMQEFSLQHIPLLNHDQRLTGLSTLHELVPNPAPPVQAVILTQTRHAARAAGGLPKPLIPVGNRPLLELVVGQLRKAGIREICLSSATAEPAVEERFGDGCRLGVTLKYRHERRSADAAGALDGAGQPLLVVRGDVLTRVDFGAMVEYHREHQADVTVAVQVHEPGSAEEVVETDGARVTAIRDQVRRRRLIDAGIYLLSPEVATRFSPGTAQEVPALIRQLLSEGHKVVSFPIHEYWMNIGNLEDYQRIIAEASHGAFDDVAGSSVCWEAGVPPPGEMIPLCVPEIVGNEGRYIKECLDSGWVSSVGPFVDSFEKMVANYVGARYGVATCNGTSALHAALLTAGVEPDEEVLVSTLTFIAPVNAIRYAGAWPVFIDAEGDYLQMDVGKLATFLETQCRWKDGACWNKATGRRVRAVVPVHILGHPCDMDAILELARKYRLVVVEDASESLGACYKGRMVGGIGDLACFSFNGNKIITTGGGGMIVTNNEAWARRAKYLTTQAKDDPVEYVHREIGYNYRLTNVQAAMGCAQMEHVDQFVERKRAIARRYTQAFAGLPGIAAPKEAPGVDGAFWLYTFQIERRRRGVGSRELLHALSKAGVQARPLWRPIHMLPPYARCQAWSVETAEAAYRSALSIPSSVGLTAAEQQTVIDAVKQSIGAE